MLFNKKNNSAEVEAMEAAVLKEERERLYAKLEETDSLKDLVGKIRIAREEMDMSKASFTAWLTKVLEEDTRFNSVPTKRMEIFIETTLDTLYAEKASKFNTAFERFIVALEAVLHFIADALRHTGDVWETTFHWVGTAGKEGLHKAADAIDKVSNRPEDKGDVITEWVKNYDAGRRNRKAAKEAKAIKASEQKNAKA